MGGFASTPVAATKWTSTRLIGGLKPDILNILLNLETIYKDIYYAPSWDNDGNPNIHPLKTAAATIYKGDLCYFPSAASIKQARANTKKSSRVQAVANSKINSGAQTRNYHQFGPWSSATYNFTPNSLLWLSAATPGKMVAYAPNSASASVLHCVGQSMTATFISFRPFSIYTEV